MEDMSRDHNEKSEAIQLTGTVTVIAMIVLFVAVVFVIFLYLYAKWFWWRVIESGPNSQQSRRSRRFVFVPGQDNAVAASRRGLELSILRALPVVVFSNEEFKDGLECAVCLCEVVKGEKARLLPKCNHGFHVDCIDMWFQSHSTCPLCRDPIAIENSKVCKSSSEEEPSSLESNSVDGSLGENPNYPTNVLFWGSENHVNSRSAGLEEVLSYQTAGPSVGSAGPSSSGSRPEGMFVIDIPRNMSEGSSLSSRFVEEEAKSPMPTRLRSLKRLLSREKRHNPCSPGSGDLEQVGRGQS